MKFNCKTEEQKRQEHIDKITKWHQFFAWTPIRIKDNDCRWLEFVEKRFVFRPPSKLGAGHSCKAGDWEYRECARGILNLLINRKE